MIYDIGAGQPYPTLSALDWSILAAGDIVQIHGRPTPYAEKILLSCRGASGSPITIRGVAGPNGDSAVLDATNATTPAGLVYPFAGTQDRGLFIVTLRLDQAFGFKPGYLTFQNLTFQGASPNNTAAGAFTDEAGAARTLAVNAAGIFVERGEHITIDGCTITGNANGIFVASGDEEALVSRDITIQDCRILGNGVVGSDHQHNTYTEAAGMVYRGNKIGRPLAGSLASGIKDRSAGTVIAYNWIEGGYSRMLDLVDAEDSPSVIAQDASYHTTLVYGNVFVNDPGDAGSLIHYGGDSGVETNYRKGTLYFYGNTVVVRSDQSTAFRKHLVGMETTDETVDLRNNVVFVRSATPLATPSDFSILNTNGNGVAGVNWVSLGWTENRPDLPFLGTFTGSGSIVTGGSDNLPGFTDEAGNDFRPTLSAAIADLSGALAGGVPAVTDEYAEPATASLHPSTRARVNVGTADLGAFEAAAFVPGAPSGLTATGGNAQVALSWSAVTGATGYHVKRSASNGGPYVTVASPSSASYTNTGLTNGTTYYYVVTSTNAYGESAASTQAFATPQVPPVVPPVTPPVVPPAGGSSSGGGTSDAEDSAPMETVFVTLSSGMPGRPYTRADVAAKMKAMNDRMRADIGSTFRVVRTAADYGAVVRTLQNNDVPINKLTTGTNVSADSFFLLDCLPPDADLQIGDTVVYPSTGNEPEDVYLLLGAPRFTRLRDTIIRVGAAIVAAPDVATILRKTATNDGAGTPTEAFDSFETVACRLLRDLRHYEVTDGSELKSISRWVVWMPVGTDIRAQDRISIGGTVYEVQDSTRGETDALCLSVSLVRISVL